MATAYNESLLEQVYPVDYLGSNPRAACGVQETATVTSTVDSEILRNTKMSETATPGFLVATTQYAHLSFGEIATPGDSLAALNSRDIPAGLTISTAMRDAFTLQVSFQVAGVPQGFFPENVGVATDYTIAGLSAETDPVTVAYVGYDHVDHPAYLYLSFTSPPIVGQSYTLFTDREFYTTTGLVTGFSATFTPTEWGRTSVLKSFIPSGLDPAQPNLNALLSALGYGDEWLGGAYPGAGAPRVRLGTTVSDALGDDLNRVGTSYSIARPTEFYDDETYRLLIGYMGVSKKATRDRLSGFLTATIGPSWGLHELDPGVLTLSLDVSGVTGDMSSASYLHADATVAATADYYGDYLVENMSIDLDPTRAARLFAGDSRQLQAIDLLKAYMLAAGIQLRVVYNIIPTDNQSGLPSILPFTIPNT